MEVRYNKGGAGTDVESEAAGERQYRERVLCMSRPVIQE